MAKLFEYVGRTGADDRRGLERQFLCRWRTFNSIVWFCWYKRQSEIDLYRRDTDANSYSDGNADSDADSYSDGNADSDADSDSDGNTDSDAWRQCLYADDYCYRGRLVPGRHRVVWSDERTWFGNGGSC